ncbi:protein kinase domain-containing protein [Bacillus cereus]|uniref:protein kinase domain-containing protein n=1 Tax=Bacillus cereus TaxID=1396 RepID=UPI0005A320C3|nr:protein kinase [Bacillus cereus]AJG57821.1 kinase domain protein [Bacillus cereus D17]QKI15111.1 protein kinase [Bacillus cereus]
MVEITEPISTYLQRKLDDIIIIHGEETVHRYTICYKEIPFPLKEILSFFHFSFNRLLDSLNRRLPTGHFTADESRELINYIHAIKKIQSSLQDTEVAFDFCTYYKRVINECKQFLEPSGGSAIPSGFEEININEIGPMFELQNGISITRANTTIPFQLKIIGEGSYAKVFKYKDTFYNCFFAVKKANSNLTKAEYQRFCTEFVEMRKLKSPYVLEVFKFDKENHQYIMEYADESLYTYISKRNNTIDFFKRINLIQQIFKAFTYIHSKNVLHRDISPSNILIKIYDGAEIIKVSDFGLIKLEESQLTNQFTEMKGTFNDPQLAFDGFSNYKIHHEIYALTRLIYFIFTGRTTMGAFTNEQFKAFFDKGTNPNREERYKDVREMQEAFKHFLSTLQQVKN